jgi:hypothetical protein
MARWLSYNYNLHVQQTNQIIHCTTGIPTTKPSPEAEYSNELNCPAVQGQPMHIVSYISMKCREHPATGLSSLWWRNKFQNPLLNFHSKTQLPRQSKVPRPWYLFMSRQARTHAHNRNVNQVFINYMYDQKSACNDAAAFQFQFYSDQKVYYRILHHTINYNFTESNENWNVVNI